MAARVVLGGWYFIIVTSTISISVSVIFLAFQFVYMCMVPYVHAAPVADQIRAEQGCGILFVWAGNWGFCG